MTSQELRELNAELDEIKLDNPTKALAEIRSILSAVIDHLYFRQVDKEHNR